MLDVVMLLGKPALGVALALSPSDFEKNVGMVGDGWRWLEMVGEKMRWTIWKNRPVFGFYLGVSNMFQRFFCPILDNRTTTFWIEGYGQIYGVSSAAGGALGHVRGFL